MLIESKPESGIVDGIPRTDAYAKVSGEARFASDVALPGMLHAKVLRSPHAHARIRRIDTSRAEGLAGVACVVTGADAAALPDPYYGVFVRDQPVIAIGKVRYVGDLVAAVAAVDEATAYRALELIDVEYEVLPALPTIEDASAPNAPALFEEPSPGIAMPVGAGSTSVKEPRKNVLYEYRYARGGVEAALATCAHVFTDVFRFSRINHFHLEPFVNVARVSDERVELWSCNQDPFILRNDIARIFGWSLDRVRIHVGFIGGGFGGKSFCKMEPLVVLLARKARAPVRLCLTMDEGLLTLTKHAAILTLTTGVAADGALAARRCSILFDGGAYSDASVTVAAKAGYRVAGPYRWSAVESSATVVRTTTVPAGSFRGFGGTQATFASESQIDMIARRLGFDPLQFRKRNLLRCGEPFAPGDNGLDCDPIAGLDQLAEQIGYHERSRAKGRGIGIAFGIKDAGGSTNHAQALVKVLASGDAIVSAAVAEIGQGGVTAMCRIAAEVLSLPAARVSYAEVDTHHTPLNNGTHVSDGTTVTGAAVAHAAEDAKAQILRFAAGALACPEEEVALADGAVHREETSYPLARLVAERYGNAGHEFIGRGEIKISADAGAPFRSKSLFWMPSWAGAEVEVDEETGRIVLHRLIVGGETGRTINAAASRGQVEGAAIQAMGQSLFEELRYDGAAPVNASASSYRVPLATDLPATFASFLREDGLGPGPFNVKGLGESGMLAVAAAVANAVEDATGARVTQIPLTPERIATACAQRRT